MSAPTENAAYFRRDILSAILFVAAADSVLSLGGFIASKHLGATELWIGVIGSAGYFGYMWNLFFARVTATLSLRRGMYVIMALGGLFTLCAALATNPNIYCMILIVILLMYGLFEVQYNSTVRHLYSEADRPRRLSRRRLAASITAMLLLLLFGRISEGKAGHMPAFLIAGAMMLAGAMVFRTIRVSGEPRMERFHAFHVAGAVLRDKALRRVAGMLMLYGWVGAGTHTLLTLLYVERGLDTAQVGQLEATRLVGLLLGYWLITPRLKFTGGLSNYRWCYVAGGIASVIYYIVGTSPPGAWTFPALVAAQLSFGMGVAVFDLAMQTTGINLAPPGKTTLYVNTLLIVQGTRGMLMPLLVAVIIKWWGMEPALTATLILGVLCAVMVMIPNIDALAKPAQSD